MSQLSSVYNQAKTYLESYLDGLNLPESGKVILEAEFKPYRRGKKPSSIDKPTGIYYKMLMSLMNKQGFPNFIGWDSVLGMADILFNYDPVKVCETYGRNFDELFTKLKERFPNKTFDITNPKNAWVQYTRGIISIAKFLSSFTDYQEFDNFVESFSFNEHSVAALPMLLEKEIFGYGFALSCDFLKESGYNSYGKPDVQLLDIFTGVGMLTERNEFECFKTIVKIAREVGEPPVIVDKLFWIIGSGKFDEYHKSHQDRIPVKRLKDDFVKLFNER